ncbi:MAG: hypothetical protein IJO62_04865 [Clostridia bacterium]|nr:hypothetical protein [Clostridia bacterium]
MEKKISPLYKAVKWFVWLFSPKFKVEGAENLPDEATLLVGNHSQMYGPIACEFYIPGKHYTWCAGEMMNIKTVPAYAFSDFWSQKSKWTHPFYRLASYIIAPLASLIFNNANTIGVFRDTRILSTFKTTVKRLNEGNNVVVFPEHDVKYNNIVYDFQDKFIDIARLYYKKTGKALSFAPLYIAPNLKKMYIGKSTTFNPELPMDGERERICKYLMCEITKIARELPVHTVVPYRNIPKKLYPKNKEG